MKNKLQDMLGHVNEMSNVKTQISGNLDHCQQQLEEAQRHFTLESDEQNRKISVLHQELKDLQEKMNNNNHQGSHLSSKVKEITET